MFIQFKRINNESGVILFVVLMVAIIIMLISAGILTQNMNETNYAQQQIDQIVSEQLAKGVFWNAYSTAYNAGQLTYLQQVYTYSYAPQGGGRTYNISLQNTGSGYQAVANYDTF